MKAQNSHCRIELSRNTTRELRQLAYSHKTTVDAVINDLVQRAAYDITQIGDCHHDRRTRYKSVGGPVSPALANRAR